MLNRKPMAFMSYACADDRNEDGRMTMFRECLSKEVSLQIGEEFEIFQDRENISWGQKWEERIDGSLDGATFLVAMITPAFFNSTWCRRELEKFLGRERSLGRNDLVLPVCYVDVPLLHDKAMQRQDPLAEAVMARQMEDWRQLRFEPFDSPQVRKAIAKMARQIAKVAKELKAGPAEPVPKGVSKPVHGSDKARQEKAPLAEMARQIAEVAKELKSGSAELVPKGVLEPVRGSGKARQEKAPLAEIRRSDRIGIVAGCIVLALLLLMAIGLVGGRHLALRPGTKASERSTESGKASANTPATSSDQPRPGDAMREETTGTELVWVPGGCFQMGSAPNSEDHQSDEAPVHEVCVDGFWLGRLETTQTQWERVMGTNPSFFKGADLPVETVSWQDVQEFLAKLNAKTGEAYRLPTEAEWEYACRAGGSGKYCGGDELDAVAWHDGNSAGTTHPGGSRAANAFGLHDMSGNVWEWCSDWHDENYYQQQVRDNPQGPATGRYRVVRGGSWVSDGRNCRSAYRIRYEPADRFGGLGFRIARGRTSKQAETRP